MQKTSISFKAFLVAVVVAGTSFTANAGSIQQQLLNRTTQMKDVLAEMRRNFDNQQDNTGPTQLTPAYRTRFNNQLTALEGMVNKADSMLRAGGGRIGGRDMAADRRIAPLLTNLVANLDRMKIKLDDETAIELIEFFEGVNPGSDQKLTNQIGAALGILQKRMSA